MHDRFTLYLRPRNSGDGNTATRSGVTQAVCVQIVHCFYGFKQRAPKNEIINSIIAQHVEIQLHNVLWINGTTAKMQRNLH